MGVVEQAVEERGDGGGIAEQGDDKSAGGQVMQVGAHDASFDLAGDLAPCLIAQDGGIAGSQVFCGNVTCAAGQYCCKKTGLCTSSNCGTDCATWLACDYNGDCPLAR